MRCLCCRILACGSRHTGRFERWRDRTGCRRHRTNGSEPRRHLLSRDPGVELLLRDGENPEAHVRMRGAAVLGAESIPHAAGGRGIRRVPQVVRAVRDDVALATELRSPE